MTKIGAATGHFPKSAINLISSRQSSATSVAREGGEALKPLSDVVENQRRHIAVPVGKGRKALINYYTKLFSNTSA